MNGDSQPHQSTSGHTQACCNIFALRTLGTVSHITYIELVQTKPQPATNLLQPLSIAQLPKHIHSFIESAACSNHTSIVTLISAPAQLFT
jgi:hypothetical protein